MEAGENPHLKVLTYDLRAPAALHNKRHKHSQTVWKEELFLSSNICTSSDKVWLYGMEFNHLLLGLWMQSFGVFILEQVKHSRQ